MSSFLLAILVLAFACQAIVVASSANGKERKLVRTEKGKRQQAVAHQEGGNVALELGSSGRLMRSAKASRKDVHDLALRGSEDQTEDRSKGDHSEAFTKAHDAIATELELKQATLTDWLFANSIDYKAGELTNKRKEIEDERSASQYWWESVWSSMKRTWLTFYFFKNIRLIHQEERLSAEVDAMTLEKQELDRQVADLMAKKEAHIDDGNVLLDGLNSQVAALATELASYESDKAAIQATQNELKEQMVEEHDSAVDVFTKLIGNLDKAIHEKRDVIYSLTATCPQYEKEGKAACKKCKNSRACGDTCISKANQCNKSPGCACDDTIGHDLHQEFNETKTALEDTIKYHEAQINTHTAFLSQNDMDIAKIKADKENADKVFEAEKQRIEAYKAQLQKDKSTAEQAKQNATNALSSATEENEAAVAGLKNELHTGILALQASKAQEQASKAALLAANAVKMKELLETHAATIAGWDAKILETKSEHTTMSSEASDLQAALYAAVGGAA